MPSAQIQWSRPRSDSELSGRARAFIAAVRANIERHRVSSHAGDPRLRLSWGYGNSNALTTYRSAVQIGGPNLALWSTRQDGLVFATMAHFPPDVELHLAIMVNSDVEAMTARLRELGVEPPEGEESSDQTWDESSADQPDMVLALERSTRKKPGNNTSMLLKSDGRLYFRLKAPSLHEDLADPGLRLGKGVDVDRVIFATYPSDPGANRTMLARTFVGHISAWVGAEKVTELQPWSGEADDAPVQIKSPRSFSVDDVVTGITRLGGQYERSVIEQYHWALNHLLHKHFVILSGGTGTGKTTLAMRYAFTIHGYADFEAAPQRDPLFFLVPVRPDWTDSSGVLGYHDALTDKYVVPTFLEAVLTAISNPQSPVFICLDEMNLARAEYYLAEVLSALEARTPLSLHGHDVPLEGTGGQVVPSRIPLPHNLYITGTINMDETTHPVSHRVLDRAARIELRANEVSAFLDRVLSDEDRQNIALTEVRNKLVEIDGFLRGYQDGISYRVAQEIVQYVKYARESGASDVAAVLDSQIAQRVLPKVRGDSQDLLTGLKNRLPSAAFTSSNAFLADLQRQLDALTTY